MNRLGQALHALAARSGLAPRPVEAPAHPPAEIENSPEGISRWLAAAAVHLGFEAEPATAAGHSIENIIRHAGPALFRIPGQGPAQFLALLPSRRGIVRVLDPELRIHHLAADHLVSALSLGMETSFQSDVDRLLDSAGLTGERRSRARQAILREQLGGRRFEGWWLLRPSPGASFWQQARRLGLPRRLLLLAGAHTLQYLLFLLSWWLIGQAVLQGRFDRGWLLAWAIILLCLIPFRLLVTWTQGQVAIRGGALLKQRLLAGALKLEPEEIRHQGSGGLLGRVMESEVVESLALTGGFTALVAIIEILLAGVVLAIGLAGWIHAALLAAWIGFAAWIALAYYRDRMHWTETRLAMTNDLVERMAGHRTRLAQQTPERWHQGEDETAQRYHELSRRMDRRAARLWALLPRGWLILGLVGLVPAFVSTNVAVTRMAISLGGILLAYRALLKLATGLSHLIGAAIGWRQVELLFQAAARPELPGVPDYAIVRRDRRGEPKNGAPLIEARDLAFRYQSRATPVLQGCSLRLGREDRILLEGTSGGGKSTLAAMLTSLRLPESGLLLLHGLDRQTLGVEGWRRRVASAPQFHENHVLTGPFAFNLLMGRCWPPRQKDMEEAEAVCKELGLGPLLQRMPAGMLQIVGETGWQLSHGEKSRLYIARALLQDADLVILDESFASLDPPNLRRSLQCVLERSRALLVIAHP